MADFVRLMRDALNMLRVLLTWGVNLSHNWRGKSRSVVARTEMNAVVPMEITFMDNVGHIFILDEFIGTNKFIYMNPYM